MPPEHGGTTRGLRPWALKPDFFVRWLKLNSEEVPSPLAPVFRRRFTQLATAHAQSRLLRFVNTNARRRARCVRAHQAEDVSRQLLLSPLDNVPETPRANDGAAPASKGQVGCLHIAESGDGETFVSFMLSYVSLRHRVRSRLAGVRGFHRALCRVRGARFSLFRNVSPEGLSLLLPRATWPQNTRGLRESTRTC